MNPIAQNAFLVSGKRIYFIFVPMSLSDQTIGNFISIEYTFAQKYIQEKLDEMIKTMSLREIYESNPINFAINLSDIKKIQIKKNGFINVQSIAFFDSNGQKLSIAIRNKADLETAENFFKKIGINI